MSFFTHFLAQPPPRMVGKAKTMISEQMFQSPQRFPPINNHTPLNNRHPELAAPLVADAGSIQGRVLAEYFRILPVRKIVITPKSRQKQQNPGAEPKNSQKIPKGPTLTPALSQREGENSPKYSLLSIPAIKPKSRSGTA